MSNDALLSAVLAGHDAGLCVVAPKEDGSKRPEPELVSATYLARVMGEEAAREILDGKTQAWTWKHRQFDRPAAEDLRRTYRNGRSGVGFVCGAISGNLVAFEFDEANVYHQFKAAATGLGLGELVERIEAGYSSATPGNGVHWLYRLADAAVDGNTKLARRPKRPEEMKDPNDKIQVLIETRGEGGYIVEAPSNGKVHPTGKSYRMLRGGIGTIASITPDEQRELFTLARTFDRLPERVHEPQPAGGKAAGGARPGDDFNTRANWASVLEPHGWTAIYTAGERTYWKRPGTDNRWSASTNYAGSDLLYCWTTSTEFESERGYSKFSVFAILTHGGDFKAAARDLAAKGFGSGREEQGGADSAGPVVAEPAWAPGVLLSEEECSRAARGTFVDEYVAYATLRTDAPRAFHEAIALAILSVVIGRRAVLRLSIGNVYPALWIFILADSSLHRKSTAMDFGEELLRLVDPELLAPNDFTPQRFVAILAEHDGRPLLFKRDEFSGFYDGLNRLDYMAGLKEVLCDVYDGRAFRREKMKPKGRKDEAPRDEEWKYDIREPFLSLAVATTEERFFEVARTNDIHSGFLPRFAFVLPPGRPGPRKALREVDLLLESKRAALARRLREIVAADADLTCEQAVFRRFDRYVADLEAEARAAPDSNMVAIVGSRISWMAWRVAMLLAVADGSRRMALPHLLRGMETAEGWRHNALRVLGGLAPSRFEKRAARLVQLVEQKDGLSRRDAMRALRISKREADDLQATLEERGEIRIERRQTPGGLSLWYLPAALSRVSTVSPGPFSTSAGATDETGPGDTVDNVDTPAPSDAEDVGEWTR